MQSRMQHSREYRNRKFHKCYCKNKTPCIAWAKKNSLWENSEALMMVLSVEKLSLSASA